MRGTCYRSCRYLVVFAALSPLSALAGGVTTASTPGSAVSNEGFSQLDAIAAAQALNKTGSDNSMQGATTNAMRALMELGQGNKTGAISNGYKAFGQYRNSGDLDNLRLRNAISALKMDSIGGYIQSKSGKSSIFMAPISDFDTTFGRLNPKFLRQGEAGQVADQFEKTTGMSRDTFLKKMTAASESDIKSSDPQLVDKVMTRFESFVKEIPNEEFRNKVQKEIDSVPQTFRTGLISKAVQKFTQLFAGAEKGQDKAPAASPSDNANRAVASPDAPKAEPVAATAPTPAKPAESDGHILPIATAMAPRAEYRGIDGDKYGSDAVGNALQTALDEQGDDTIFRQISRKYRSLTAALTQRAM